MQELCMSAPQMFITDHLMELINCDMSQPLFCNQCIIDQARKSKVPHYLNKYFYLLFLRRCMSSSSSGLSSSPLICFWTCCVFHACAQNGTDLFVDSSDFILFFYGTFVQRPSEQPKLKTFSTLWWHQPSSVV